MSNILRFAVLIFGVAMFSGAAVQAQVESKTYTIFFTSQAANVTTEADEVLVLASNYALQGAKGIDIMGHADTAEKAPSKLSLLRAKNVAEALHRHGLPKSVVVVTKGVGTAELAVPTGHSTLNRTVTIVIH
jgi:outer membrane protein OmpA-like peptidoglycan-associated protein